MVQGLAKTAATDTASILHEGDRIIVPRGTRMTVDTVAVHYNPRIWGPNAHQYNPDRWVSTDGHSGVIGGLFKPPKGAFLPFSEGSRSCIGRIFAETEFKAIITSIFETHNVELVPQVDLHTGKYESWKVTRQRALNSMNNGTTVLTFGMNELVPLRVVRK